MAIGLDDNDERAAWCVRQTIDMLDRLPTQPELNFQVGVLTTQGAQAVLGGLYRHPEAVAFRARRTW